MYFQHIRVKKVKLNDLKTMQHHLMAQSDMNHAIENLVPTRLNRRIQERIAQLHLRRRLRSDAILLADIVIGSSTGFMQNAVIECREQYFIDALHFFQNHYGKENVLYCQCHVEESNPHIHVGIMPITTDGRISASNLFAAKSLKVLRKAFHSEIASKYGLALRGEHHWKKHLGLCFFKMKQLKSKFETLFSEKLGKTAVDKRSSM